MKYDKAAHWNAKYLEGIPGWDRQGASAALHDWLNSGALSPCAILVPGCGRGHEVVELAQRGFSVTALDIAPAALDFLQKELVQAGLHAELVLGDVHDWQPATPFDAIYEQTCLCALPPVEWPAYEAQLYNWLRPGGQLYALFMQTGQEGGPPFHCALPEMHTLFAAQRWLWPNDTAREVAHFGGKFEYATRLQKRPESQ